MVAFSVLFLVEDLYSRRKFYIFILANIIVIIKSSTFDELLCGVDSICLRDLDLELELDNRVAVFDVDDVRIV